MIEAELEEFEQDRNGDRVDHKNMTNTNRSERAQTRGSRKTLPERNFPR